MTSDSLAEQTAVEPVTHVGDEYERERVPRRALLGFGSFFGMYAGEHTAGTELMIGPLFVAAGVSAFDVVVGLLVGNILAVLSWTLFTAPIATRARLTLYYQLEKICGRQLVLLYNLANGIMFCFLAGSMVTVSATAVGVWIKFPMPGLDDLYPNSVGWIVAVLVVGLMISIVAAYGYNMVSRIANLAAPWMLLVFLGFGFVGLRDFVVDTNAQVGSLQDLWQLLNTSVWKGGEPLPGQVKFTFWHVTFFAWFCNMAMHIGMSDLSVLRFAQVLVWFSDFLRHVPRTLHGLALCLDSLCLAVAPDAREYGCLTRSLGRSGDGPGGTDLRRRGRLDHRQSDDLSGGIGIPVLRSPHVSVQGHFPYRTRRHARRRLSCHRHEVAGLRVSVWAGADADGSGRVRRFLAHAAAGIAGQLRPAHRGHDQLGGRSGVARNAGGSAWRRFISTRKSSAYAPSRSISCPCPDGSWPRCSTSCSAPISSVTGAPERSDAEYVPLPDSRQRAGVGERCDGPCQQCARRSCQW